MIINGKCYDWGDVDVKLPGLAALEVEEISYDDELEKEAVYGRGLKARGYGRGNYKAEGKMTLLRDYYDDLLDYCKGQGVSLFGLVVPKVVVSYANDGARTRSDTLNRVTFTKRSSKAAQGDKNLKVELDFLAVGGIDSDGVQAI